MAQRVAPLDALPRPSTHPRPTPSTRKAGWGGRGGTEASRLYFMDEKGNVVDADVVPGLLPRIATASMETDFVHQCDLKWRSSLELPATLYLLLAVAGCGFGDAFQRRAGTLPIRASSAGAAIIVACAMIWLKQSLSAAKMQAVFASAATFCVRVSEFPPSAGRCSHPDCVAPRRSLHALQARQASCASHVPWWCWQ